jgi:hypothetical protein
MALEAAYYNDSGFFSGFVRGKTFGHAQMSGAKFLILASITR